VVKGIPPCFPLNCGVRDTPRAPTSAILLAAYAYNRRVMGASSPFEQIAGRVERLLLHHAQLQEGNALLRQQVASLTQERDALELRMRQACERLDVLLQRLPPSAVPAPHSKDAP